MILAYKVVLKYKSAPSKLNGIVHTASTLDLQEDTLDMEDRPVLDVPHAQPGFHIEYLNFYKRENEDVVRLDAALIYTLPVYRHVVALAKQGRIRACVYFNDKLVGKCYLDDEDPHLFRARLDWHDNKDAEREFMKLLNPDSGELSVLIKVFLDHITKRTE